MTPFWVVRRSFKTHGQLMEIGTVVEDLSTISVYRSRIADRDLVQFGIDRRKDAMWYEYLKPRVNKPLDKRILEAVGLATESLVEESAEEVIIKKKTKTISKVPKITPLEL